MIIFVGFTVILDSLYYYTKSLTSGYFKFASFLPVSLSLVETFRTDVPKGAASETEML